MSETPPVTVVVLNFNGREHLEPCFASLRALDYPSDRVHLHLVDNGSTDGSAAFMRERFAGTQVTVHPTNLGFSAAINRAVEVAETPYVAFLNNDTRVLPDWLGELVGPVARGEAAAAASHIVDWDGRDDLYQGGGCNFHGIGFQAGLHGMKREHASPREPVEVLFACGAAMVMPRDLFLEVGGFDEDFFAFYEDVDLGWRLWVLGHRVVLVPTSVVHHHHSATASRVPIHQLRVLHMRNPLLTILKNYEDAHVMRALPAALMLSIRRMSFLANVDADDFRIERGAAPAAAPRRRWLRRKRNDSEVVTVPKVALSDLVALEDVNRLFDRFVAKRREIQSRRRRPDREIFPLFMNPFWCAEQAETYRRLQESLVEFFGIDDIFRASGGDGGRG